MTSVLISLLAVLRGVVRSRAALHLEVLALRHQLLLSAKTPSIGDFLWSQANDSRERPRADDVATLIVYAPEPCADSVFPSPSAPGSMCSPMLHASDC